MCSPTKLTGMMTTSRPESSASTVSRAGCQPLDGTHLALVAQAVATGNGPQSRLQGLDGGVDLPLVGVAGLDLLQGQAVGAEDHGGAGTSAPGSAAGSPPWRPDSRDRWRSAGRRQQRPCPEPGPPAPAPPGWSPWWPGSRGGRGSPAGAAARPAGPGPAVPRPPVARCSGRRSAPARSAPPARSAFRSAAAWAAVSRRMGLPPPISPYRPCTSFSLDFTMIRAMSGCRNAGPRRMMSRSVKRFIRNGSTSLIRSGPPRFRRMMAVSVC